MYSTEYFENIDQYEKKKESARNKEEKSSVSSSSTRDVQQFRTKSARWWNMAGWVNTKSPGRTFHSFMANGTEEFAEGMEQV